MSKALIITLTLSSIYFEKLRQVRRIQLIKSIKSAAMNNANMERMVEDLLGHHQQQPYNDQPQGEENPDNAPEEEVAN
ncbi:hypothetical protein Ciccas_003383 [Cichlidogyrus casuarinus]|uniref:Uncharacterized protein n=1 Tax=Cichlidogyrus casuarinus TaxID=1844966 RepID=A0ABD2QEJ1_9PLAT